MGETTPNWAEAIERRWPGHSFMAEPVEAWARPGAPFEDRTSRRCRQYLFLESGHVLIRLAGSELEIPPGMLLLMPPNIPWSVQASPDARGIWMAGGEGYVIGVLAASMFTLPPEGWEGTYTPTLIPVCPGPENAARRTQAYAELLAARARLSLSEAAVAIYMMMIFNAEMLRADRPGPRGPTMLEPVRDPDARLMLSFRGLVEDHLAEQLGLDAYIRRLGVSAERLNRACREIEGVTPLAFLTNRAVQRAKVDLRYSNDPMTLVGARIGYPDPAHFSRFFKRHTGLSPSAYREKCAQAGAATAASHEVELRLTAMGALWRQQAPAEA